MTTKGPLPKRSDQRRRTNTPAAGEPTEAPGAAVVEPPEADPDWHPVAAAWYVSLGESGQSRFYEPSDWATAVVIAESMSRELKAPEPLRAAALKSFLHGMTLLLCTEGDRRRAAIELHRPKAEGEEAGDVAWLDDARARANKSG